MNPTPPISQLNPLYKSKPSDKKMEQATENKNFSAIIPPSTNSEPKPRIPNISTSIKKFSDLLSPREKKEVSSGSPSGNTKRVVTTSERPTNWHGAYTPRSTANRPPPSLRSVEGLTVLYRSEGIEPAPSHESDKTNSGQGDIFRSENATQRQDLNKISELVQLLESSTSSSEPPYPATAEEVVELNEFLDSLDAIPEIPEPTTSKKPSIINDSTKNPDETEPSSDAGEPLIPTGENKHAVQNDQQPLEKSVTTPDETMGEADLDRLISELHDASLKMSARIVEHPELQPEKQLQRVSNIRRNMPKTPAAVTANGINNLMIGLRPNQFPERALNMLRCAAGGSSILAAVDCIEVQKYGHLLANLSNDQRLDYLNELFEKFEHHLTEDQKTVILRELKSIEENSRASVNHPSRDTHLRALQSELRFHITGSY